MKRLFTSLILVAAGLVACQTAPTPVVEKPEYQLLGKLELAFGETPIGMARAKFTPVGLRGQAVVNESQLIFFANTFSTAVRTADNNRFLNAQFWIGNSTGSTLQNLLLVATHRTGNEGGSALKNMNNFNNVNLANYARAVKPSHPMSGNGTVSVVPDKEHLALFSEYDVDRMTAEAGAALGSNEYLLPYGYLVSKFGATGDPDNYYNIPPNTAAYTGEVTVSMRVDGNNEPPSSNAYRFTFTAMVFQQATLPLDKSPIAESLEEISTSAAGTRAGARNAVGGFNQTYFLHNSSNLTVNNNALLKNNVCQVRTAGTIASPTNLSPTLPNFTVGELNDCFGAGGRLALNYGKGFTNVAKFADGRLALVGMTENINQTPINTWGILKPNGANASKQGFFSFGTTNLRTRAVTVDSQGRMIWAAEDRNTISDNQVYIHRRSASVTTSMNVSGGDSTFGTGGTSVITVGSFGSDAYASAVATQSDDKIIVAGVVAGNRIWIRRLNATDGSSDSTFVFSAGFLPATTNLGVSQILSMAIDSNDKIIVTGNTREAIGDDPDLFVARFNADGSADTTFDSDGYKIQALSTSTDDRGQSVVLDGNKILVAGYVVQLVQSQNRKVLTMVRFNSDGTLDTTFNSTGILTRPEDYTDIEAKKVLLQPNGRIIMVSYPLFALQSSTNNDRTVRVERYSSNGALDTAFNPSGTTPGRNEYDVIGVRETAEGAVITGSNTDAKLIVVGATNENGATFRDFLISINLGDIISTGGSSN
jgi:uncharacterized delta-60 repeat protein